VNDPGSTHTWTSWRQITQEIVNARVWEGVHFRNSNNTAAITGLKIGGFDVHKLRSIGINLGSGTGRPEYGRTGGQRV
jgi:hypothetical protein